MTDRIWLERYPEGVPADIDVAQFDSLTTLIEECFARHASSVGYNFMGRDISYRQVDSLSQAFGAYLQGLGLVKGDRVAVMMPNVPQYPMAVAAILRAGLVLVNVNPLYTARELEHQLKDSGAKAIVILENFAATLEKCLASTAIKHVVLCAMGDQLGLLKGTLVNYVVRHSKKLVPAVQYSRGRALQRSRGAWHVGAMDPARHHGATTWRCCNTPAAPPACPRAPCCCTATWWPTCCRTRPGARR